MATVFKRDELYAEVWATPLTQLGKKYGLSDNGLRKICRAMNIPLPVAGHWAKIAAGQRVRQSPLPADAECTTYTSYAAPAETPHRVPEDDAWLAERQSFETRPENQIAVDPKPRRWHAVLAPLRDQLRQTAKDHQRDLKVAEKASQRPLTRAEEDAAGYGWRWFVDHGQVLGVRHKAAPMKVTPVTLDRALLIANSLFSAAEARGFTVLLKKDQSRFLLEGHGGSIELRFMDKLADSVRMEHRARGEISRYGIKAPTGILRIGVTESYSEKEVADATNKPVETQLNALFIQIYRLVVRCRERQRAHDERERLWAEKQRQLALEEHQRQEAKRRKEAEKRRREELISEADAWHRSQAIKEYVAHIMGVAERTDIDSALHSPLLEWQKWSLEVADALDPTASRLQGRNKIAIEEP